MAVNAEEIRPVACEVCGDEIYPCNDRYQYNGMTICDDPQCLIKAANIETELVYCTVCGAEITNCDDVYIVDRYRVCNKIDCLAHATGAKRIDD